MNDRTNDLQPTLAGAVPARLHEMLRDPAITDLCFNEASELYVDRGAGMELASGPPIFTSESEYRAFVLAQLSASGKTWDAKLPFVDAVFFGTHRAHLAFPPLSVRGIVLSLRKLPVRISTDRTELQSAALQRWTASAGAFKILREAVEAHDSILFAGGTGSGKTTLLNDLMGFIPPGERVITIEDTPEIRSPHPHTLSLITRAANADGFGAVNQRDLFRQTLRMRPDRILVGECRGDEVLDLLQALNSGHRGFMATLHANSARDALKRMELLALIAARGTIPGTLIQDLLVNGVQLLVHLERAQGVRRITSIHRIHGKEREVILTRPLYPVETPGSNSRAGTSSPLSTPVPVRARP